MLTPAQLPWPLLVLLVLLPQALGTTLSAFDNHDGDGAHTGAFFHFDVDDDETVSVAELARFEVPEHHVSYYDRDGVPGLSYQEFIRFWRERKLFDKAKLDGPDPPGHNQPLGAHRRSLGSPDVVTPENPISPQVFWEKYVQGHRPVLFKGVDKDSVAARLWSQEYVAEKFGWIDLKLEPKLEARGDESILSAMPHRMNISRYLHRAKTENLYAVSVMPQAMAWDVNIPAAMQCGSRTKQLDPTMKSIISHPFPHASKDWLTHIYEANLWLSVGRTRSQLHYDRENNVNCAYHGKKRWILIDTRKHYSDITWVRGGRYRSEDDLLNTGTDWVPIDPDKVDLRVHQKLSNVEYYEFDQEVGDCIFLPYSMLHYVNKTSPGFHVAASWMFLPNEVFDKEACETAPTENIPMAAHDILWYYSGTGVIPQGYPAVDREVRDSILQIMDENGEDHMTIQVLQEWLSRGEAPLRNRPRELRQFWEEFSRHGKNPDKGLTQEEMGWPNTPLGLWLRFAARGDPEGMLPCDTGQFYIPRPENETAKSNLFLEQLGGNPKKEL